MVTGHNKVELTITEIEPALTSTDEHERKTEAALEVFSKMVCKGINAENEKSGSSPVTDYQARKIVLYWARKK